jgi:hypothetical protein
MAIASGATPHMKKAREMFGFDTTQNSPILDAPEE